VPRSESLVLGVTSLRDRLLPLLSLRSLLGFSTDSESDGREAVIVARVGGTRVGLVADRARAILSAPASSIDPVPAVLAARVGGESRIKAICRADQGRRLVSLLAPEQLFREDVMRRIEQDLSQAAPHEREDNLTPQNLLSFLVFRLGDDEYALPIDAVDEVGEVPSRVTRLPKTPKFLEGVVNLRGELLPVIDQCRRFDIPVSDHAERRRLLVVHSAGQRAGLIVDGVSDVLHVPSDALEPPPELTEHVGQLVQGVINLASQQRLVLVLDPAGLLTSKERDVLDRFNPASSQANA
jgi:purine-binding chemotaxis protein CheW